jgi:hypothetical protein
MGGQQAAVAGGVIGAVTGAALGSHRAPGVAVHYGPGYGYAPPPVYYPARPRGPLLVAPPVVYAPHRGPGYWAHAVDAWGRPLLTWVPAPGPRHYAPPPRRSHHPHGYRDGYRHGRGW